MLLRNSNNNNTTTKSAVTHHTERSKCRKLMTGPETKKMVALMNEFKDKVSSNSSSSSSEVVGVRSLTMWNLQLRLSMDMGLVALELLKFLDEVTAFEELSTDLETDIIPYLDDVIEDMEEAGDPIFIITAAAAATTTTTNNNNSPPPPLLLLLWKPDETRDAKTIQRLNQIINDLNKVTTTVFAKEESEIDMDGRFSIMRACHSLFEAILDLVKNCEVFFTIMEYGDELVAMLEDAVVKCSSEEQSLEEYYYYFGGARSVEMEEELGGENDD